MAVDQIITEFLTRGEGNLRATLKGLSSDMSTFEGRQARVEMASNALVAGGTGVVGVLGLIGAVSLKSAGQLEGVEAGLTSMLGSSELAKSKIAELQKFAQETPFDFGETAAASQQLLAMGFAADDLVPTLRNVGNAVAAAGGGTEEFRGVLTALGQIQTKGKLSAEELMQMAERGIPVFQILQKELGLTREQVSEIGSSGMDAKTGIDALVRGMGAVGGGTALEEMSNTLPGKLSNLGDSVNQLSASVGKLFSQDAKDFIGGVSNAVDKIREFVETSPGLAKGLLGGVAAAGAVAIGAGAIGKLAGIYNEVTRAKKGLLGATIADDLAEKAKAITAGKEGDAISDVGEAAKGTAGKLGLLARAKAFLTNPLTLGGNNFQVPLAMRGAFGGGGANWTLGSIGAQGGARTMGMVTGAGAAASIGLGAVAGVAANNNMRAAGYSEGQAAAYGAITGIGAAGVAAFVPGGAIAVAAGEGMAWAINHFVNKPMEDRAENGPRDNEGNVINNDDMGGTAREQEKKQWERAQKLAETGSEEDANESWIAGIVAKNRRTRAKMQEQEAKDAAERAKNQAAEKKRAEDRRVSRLQNATDFYNSITGTETQRNGARTVTIRMPESSGDEMARQLAFNSNTASPNYG